MKLVILLASICIISCSQHQKESAKEAPKTLPRTKPGSSYRDTLVIKGDAAVFYEADSLQLRKIKEQMDSGAFSADMHEYEFLFNTSRAALKRSYPSLNVITATKARYIVFSDAIPATVIDLDKNVEPCGLYFFMHGKSPHPVDMANIDTEVGYFR